VHPSDHVALALLAAQPEATSRHLTYELDWTRTYAAARLHSLERQGLAVPTLGDGGSFRWRVTPAGSARLADLPEPPFADVGGPLSRYKR
jgi:DNA-binding MarR family transcriptional regulator